MIQLFGENIIIWHISIRSIRLMIQLFDDNISIRHISIRSIRIMVQLFGDNIIIWHSSNPLIQMNPVTDCLEIRSFLQERGKRYATQLQMF